MYLFSVAANDLRRRLRDPLALALMVAVPLGIAIILRLTFGGADGEGLRPTAEVIVVDHDQSMVSKLLLDTLDQAGDRMPMTLRLVDDEREARDELDRGKGTALLVIPKGFDRALLLEEPATLQLVINPTQRVLPQIVEESLNLMVEAHFYAHRVAGATLAQLGSALDPNDPNVAAAAIEFSDLTDRLSPWLDPRRLDLDVTVEEPVSEEDDGDDAFKLDLAGIMMTSILAMTLLFASLGMSQDLWIEKDGGTLRRAQVSPNPLSAWLAGTLLSHFVIFGALAAIGLLLARHAFGIEFVGGLGAALWISAGCAVFDLLLVLTQTLSTTRRGGSMIANLVTYPLLMLGGAFFPLEAMPDSLAAIGRVTPTGWGLVQMKLLLADRLGGAALGQSILLLVATGAVLFAITVRRLPLFSSR